MSDPNITLTLNLEDYAFLLFGLRVARDCMIREEEDVSGMDRLIEKIRRGNGGVAA